MHHREQLSQTLAQLFPEGSLDATRMIQRCQKNGLYPIAASRTLVLQLGKNSPLDGQSPLIVWVGLAHAFSGQELVADKSQPGIEEVKEDFLRHRVSLQPYADSLTWASQEVIEQMGLTMGKISPLDFINQSSPVKRGIILLSRLASNFLSNPDKNKSHLPVIVPTGNNSVAAYPLEDLIFHQLCDRLSPIWTVVG